MAARLIVQGPSTRRRRFRRSQSAGGWRSSRTGSHRRTFYVPANRVTAPRRCARARDRCARADDPRVRTRDMTWST